MTSNPKRIVLHLTLFGVVCALVGGLIGRRFAFNELESRNNPQTWNEHVTHEFERIVHPTPEQGPRVQAHLDRAVRELRDIRRETLVRSTNVIGQLVRDVEAELTPEQRKAFETMKPRPGELNLDILNTTPESKQR
jgi:hypothetical protein